MVLPFGIGAPIGVLNPIDVGRCVKRATAASSLASMEPLGAVETAGELLGDEAAPLDDDEPHAATRTAAPRRTDTTLSRRGLSGGATAVRAPAPEPSDIGIPLVVDDTLALAFYEV